MLMITLCLLFSKSIPDLIKTLESEYEIAIKWFENNEMIVNPDKFQAIILNRFGRENKEQMLHFNGVEVKAHNSVKLLGIEIDSNLNFNNHIHTLTKRAAGQLNYLCRN